jgi:hypothetical protein
MRDARLHLSGVQDFQRVLDGQNSGGRGQAMEPRHVMINLLSATRMLAWSALIVITLVLALLLQALAASAGIAPGPVALSTACQAALAAGDNEREGFLEHSCGGAAGATSYHLPGRPY